jgi:formylglycine-generating enzyme required for sulfatase activity
MLCGGSWNNNPNNLGSANRNRNTSANRNNNNGFRLASTTRAFSAGDTIERQNGWRAVASRPCLWVAVFV